MNQYNVAIVGATGLVGQAFLKVLEEYQLPIGEVRLFASSRSLGKTIVFRDEALTVDVIREGAFKGIDFALFSAGKDVAKQYAPQAVKEGAIVIDNSSAFRMEKDIPLVVPEINLEQAFHAKIIANPNCSTIQSVLPLYALKNAFGILQVEYNTYQAVSGSGFKGLKDLRTDSEDFYPYDIKNTCIPQIDDFLEDGYTKEEHKMVNETRKILQIEDLPVVATCVRVPVRFSHAVSIRVKLKTLPSLQSIRTMLAKQEGVYVLDDPSQNIYPTGEASTDSDTVFVGRIRKDFIDPTTILMYVVADNIRKGAASNAIQIMKGLMAYDQRL